MMLTGKNSLELQGIAKAGGSLEVDGKAYNSLELQGVARALSKGATLKVHNSGVFNSLELQGIANAAPGSVTFA